MIRQLLLCIVLVLGLSAPSFAWWDTGHMAVAEIAYERLTPKTRARVDALVKVGAQPENADFVTSACWADDLKAQSVHFYDTWHYTDAPFYDGVYSKDKAEGDLLWAINECRQLLLPRPVDRRRPGQTPTPVPEEEQARALRFFIHLAGDAHMPLHAVSRFSPDTPRGDRGGNDYKLAEGNLHAFWDSGAGLFAERLKRPLDEAGRTAILGLTKQATTAYPPEQVPEWANGAFSVWTDESFQLARDEVYKTPAGKGPSPEYVKRAQELCLRRIALAGYRLAAALNAIYDGPRSGN